MSLRTLDELEDTADGLRLLVRTDLNSPVEGGVVQDNKRFERHAETIAELAERGHRVAVMAHQGRPGRDTYVSLEQHAEVLAEHLNRDVDFVADVHGEDAIAALRNLDSGEILLLENVRFSEDELADRTAEEHAESEFVTALSAEVDAYVNDAYSAAHRAHASLVGFPQVLNSYAGRVMAAEYEYNTSIREREFEGSVVMVLGGTKADDLIAVMERLDDRVDTFLTGGILGELFLRAAGYDVGYDVEGSNLFDDQWEAERETIEGLLGRYGDRIRLPADLAFADEDGERVEVRVKDAEKTHPFLDVGEETIDSYATVVESAEAVFVKGALGVFEDERFSRGTVGILERIAATECFSVVGGGDTARAIDLYGLAEDDFSHVSIAGGAYARALTGESLPAIEALRR